jgi:hypothetical protein
MQTMETEVKITGDRRLRLDMELPDHMPIGLARVEIKIIPFYEKKEEAPKSIMDFYGRFKGMNAFGGNGVEVQRRLRDEW